MMRQLSITSIVVMGLALMTFESASAQVMAGEDNVFLELSGQLNRGLLITNDGNDTDVFNVDNDNSSSRFRLVGTYKGLEGLTVGARFEFQVESNSTADVNQENKRASDGDFFGLRKAEIWFDTPYGRLWLGQGSTASDGTAEVDLSGTDVITYSQVRDLAGGIRFFDDTANMLTDITIGDTYPNYDGLSRDDRIGYDTPKLAGFQFSGSWVTDDRWDAALRYAGDFGGLKLASAISYAMNKPSFDTQVAGSISALLKFGLNLTFAGGYQDIDESDQSPYYVYGKLGYTTKFIAFGKTSFSIDYYYGEDADVVSDESKSIGFGFVQKIDAYATELYLGLRHHDLNRDDTDLNHIFAVLTGARVKF